MHHQKEHRCDVLIVGSGAAGLSLALQLAQDLNVVVLSKGPLREGSTLYAQGGIAAVFDENDSIASHVNDTLVAGAGLCEDAAVQFTAENAKEAMEWLIAQGVPFDQYRDDDGVLKYHLTREGGHSHRRILHAADAEGWTVINSLRGGAAGGGTRMRKGLDMNEVLSLAKTMEVKFSVSGPAIGGAKSGINFDPNDPRKKGVLERWYKAVSPLLKNYYGTGGDLNVDEIHEVIPMTEDCGVWHPQEGVFNGHFKPTEADKINRIGQLRQGVIKVIENPNFSPDVNRKYTVADMITGYGVAEAARH